jgi:hypothetical protein
MNRRKTSAAFIVVMALILAMPVVAAAKPPGFQPTHMAGITGTYLSAVAQPVKQETNRDIIHADPVYQSYTITISDGFFFSCDTCPSPGTYPAYLSINDYDGDGVWLMYLMVITDVQGYRIEASGVLDQSLPRKGRQFTPFTFTPTAVSVYYSGAYGEWIGYGDPNFSISGTPIE